VKQTVVFLKIVEDLEILVIWSHARKGQRGPKETYAKEPGAKTFGLFSPFKLRRLHPPARRV